MSKRDPPYEHAAHGHNRMQRDNPFVLSPEPSRRIEARTTENNLKLKGDSYGRANAKETQHPHHLG